MNKSDFVGKKTEVIVKGLEIVSNENDVILIEGYANRFLDENGQLVVDRSKESVVPEAYDLKSFMKNPVLLYQHFSAEPVGKVINVDIRPDGLYIQAEVHKIMNEKVYYAVQNGILKTFSIGFLVRDVQEIDDIYFWTDVELLEVSIVSVPDNQESTFSILTESPCGTGTCLLANKALSKDAYERAKAINNTKVSDKPWSEVNKTELKQKLEEYGNASYIKEAFLVVRDVEKRSTWKFPHHEFNNGELILNKGGVVSAYAALKGARNEPAISTAEKKEAAKHLLKHYRLLKEKGMIEEIPEDLINMAKEFEEMHTKEIEALNDAEEVETDDVITKDADENADDEQNANDDTIDSSETKQDEPESDNQDPSSSNDEGGEEDSDEDSSDSGEEEKVSVDALKEFVREAKNTTEGLNELLELYSEIEEALNEAFSELQN